MIAKNIEAVIFDLGGVLFDIDYHATANAFKNLGMKNFDDAYSQAKQNNVFDEFEMGNISNDILRNFVRTNIEQNLTDAQIDTAWNAMLIGMPAFKFETLKKLQPHFKLYLLSNTNGIHLPKVQQMIELNTPGKSLENHFIKTYYSNKIHLRKPNADAFELVLSENNLTPENTLFIDDTQQHIDGATKCNINTCLITKQFTTEKLFERYL
jgi:putative hydrolase of the HAD superfamily